MCSNIKVRISRIESGVTDIPFPAYATSSSSGMDIHAAVNGDKTIKPGETVLIPTGFQIEIPPGYEGQIRPRSGLAIKHGISVLNTPGTIDADYRGEVKVILINLGTEDFAITRGDRIAQLVITPVVRAQWEEVPVIEKTARGSGGFGHTGK